MCTLKYAYTHKYVSVLVSEVVHGNGFTVLFKFMLFVEIVVTNTKSSLSMYTCMSVAFVSLFFSFLYAILVKN